MHLKDILTPEFRQVSDISLLKSRLRIPDGSDISEYAPTYTDRLVNSVIQPWFTGIMRRYHQSKWKYRMGSGLPWTLVYVHKEGIPADLHKRMFWVKKYSISGKITEEFNSVETMSHFCTRTRTKPTIHRIHHLHSEQVCMRCLAFQGSSMHISHQTPNTWREAHFLLISNESK